MKKTVILALSITFTMLLVSTLIWTVQAKEITPSVEDLSQYDEHINYEHINGYACDNNQPDGVWLVEFYLEDDTDLLILNTPVLLEALRDQYPNVWNDFIEKDQPCVPSGLTEEEVEALEKEESEAQATEVESYGEEMDLYDIENIVIENSSMLQEYEQYLTKENFSIVGGEGIDDVTYVIFRYEDDNNSLIKKIIINNGEILTNNYNIFDYDALEDFQNNYYDLWEFILQENNSIIHADNEKLNKYGDILKCLNVVNKKQDENGKILEITFLCNFDKNLIITDEQLIEDFIFDETEEWEIRDNISTLDNEYYNSIYEEIDLGNLLFLETDENNNLTFFVIGDIGKNLTTGEYYSSYGGHDDEFFILGDYIKNNPDKWQEKLNWFKNERNQWLKENDTVLKGDVLHKWIAELNNVELYEMEYIPFIDTPFEAWYTPHISILKSLGVISGYKDTEGNETGYFAPDSEVTYAEFLKMSLNIFGLGEKLIAADAPYWENSEVDALSDDGYTGHWGLRFYKIAKFLNTRVVEEPEFDLNKPIKRKEVIGLIVDLVGDKLPVEDQESQTANCFSDLIESDKYSQDICYLKHLGFISGYDDGTFKGETGVNRAETAKILDYMSDYVGNPLFATYIDPDDNQTNECVDCEECISLKDFLETVINESGTPIDTSGTPQFVNLETDYSHYDYFATAYNLRLIDLDVTLFDKVARANAARIIVDLFGLEDNGENIDLSNDVLEDAWYAEYVKIFAQQNIETGENFYPGGFLIKSDFDEWIDKLK